MISQQASEPKNIRCPYCVESDEFKVMIGQGDGEWFMCARCGHLAMPGNPHFKCTCHHCVRVMTVPKRART